MQAFVTFLKESKHSAFETGSDKPMRIVMGNTSGDMDSIVGAMGLAYLLTLKSGQLWTPVVNCLKADLKLKAEIYGHLIDDCKLNIDDLFFWDDLM